MAGHGDVECQLAQGVVGIVLHPRHVFVFLEAPGVVREYRDDGGAHDHGERHRNQQLHERHAVLLRSFR